MIDLTRDCTLFTVSKSQLITDFDCGNEELNDFFNQKALLFKEHLLAMTCFFRYNENGKIVCVFSLSPNALKTTDLLNSRRKKCGNLFSMKKLCSPNSAGENKFAAKIHH